MCNIFKTRFHRKLCDLYRYRLHVNRDHDDGGWKRIKCNMRFIYDKINLCLFSIPSRRNWSKCLVKCVSWHMLYCIYCLCWCVNLWSNGIYSTRNIPSSFSHSIRYGYTTFVYAVRVRVSVVYWWILTIRNLCINWPEVMRMRKVYSTKIETQIQFYVIIIYNWWKINIDVSYGVRCSCIYGCATTPLTLQNTTHRLNSRPATSNNVFIYTYPFFPLPSFFFLFFSSLSGICIHSKFSVPNLCILLPMANKITNEKKKNKRK